MRRNLKIKSSKYIIKHSLFSSIFSAALIPLTFFISLPLMAQSVDENKDLAKLANEQLSEVSKILKHSTEKECGPQGTDKNESKANAFLKAGDIQDAIWAYSEEDNEEKATMLKTMLRASLRKSKILSKKSLQRKDVNNDELDGGKHASYKVKLDNGIDAVFKPYSFSDISMSYKNEIAAYEVDQALGLNIVPMTVQKTVDGVVGSLQVFMKNAKSAKEIEKETKEDMAVPPLMKLFDFIIRGTDRNKGNYMFKVDNTFKNGFGRPIAIDHGWAFRKWDLYHQKPGSNRWDMDKGKVILNYLPDIKTYQKLKSLKDTKIRKHLSKYLSNAKITDILKRKNLFIYKVEKWIKKEGVDKTFNPYL